MEGKGAGPPIPRGSQFGKFDHSAPLPRDAVVLSDDEMAGVVRRTIANWNPTSEMWPFKIGNVIISSAAAVSAIIINIHFRGKFKLANFGPLLTFAPVCIIPTITTIMTQDTLIVHRLALQKFDCPTCAQINSACLMVCTGIIQPCLLSIFACSVIARTRHTIPLPPINSRRIITVYGNMLRPFRNALLGLTLLDAAVGMFMTEQQARSMMKVHDKMAKGL